jgi:transposase
VIRVEQWAELRRLYFVRGLSIKEIQRRTGFHQQTIRRALRSEQAPRYGRAPRPSKLDPFKEEVHRLLREEPRLPGFCETGRPRRGPFERVSGWLMGWGSRPDRASRVRMQLSRMGRHS